MHGKTGDGPKDGDLEAQAQKFAKDNSIVALSPGMPVNFGAGKFFINSFGDDMIVLRRAPGTRIMSLKQFGAAFGRGHV